MHTPQPSGSCPVVWQRPSPQELGSAPKGQSWRHLPLAWEHT